MRYLEGHDHDYTIASRCALALSRALAALLLTIDGLPMIYNGEEVGNKVPQLGWWSPLIDWSNPDAARYRETYTVLIGIRSRYPALRRGSLIAIASSDDRVAAFARVLPGEQTILTVINFSDATLKTRLDLSGQALEVAKDTSVSDLLENEPFAVANPGTFTLTLKPYQSRILLMPPKP